MNEFILGIWLQSYWQMLNEGIEGGLERSEFLRRARFSPEFHQYRQSASRIQRLEDLNRRVNEFLAEAEQYLS